MSDEYNLWNGEYRFWGTVDCNALFDIFDTSANVNHGEPSDSVIDEVLEHIAECDTCMDHDVRLSIDTDGKYDLEWS